jgi:hypothetical protein
LPDVLPEPVGHLTGALLHGRDAGEGVGVGAGGCAEIGNEDR